MKPLSHRSTAELRRYFLHPTVRDAARQVESAVDSMRFGLDRIDRFTAHIRPDRTEEQILRSLMIPTATEATELLCNVNRGLLAARQHLVWLPIWPMPLLRDMGPADRKARIAEAAAVLEQAKALHREP